MSSTIKTNSKTDNIIYKNCYLWYNKNTMIKKINLQLDIQQDIQLEEAEKGDWIVEGYATTLGRNSHRMRMTTEALEQVAENFKTYTTILFNHDSEKPIGKMLEAKADGVGVWVKARISKSEPDYWKKVQDGTLNKFSIQYEAKTRRIFVDGEFIDEIIEAFAVEASLVSIPAQNKAEAVLSYVN